MGKIVYIMGKSAAGKDSIYREMMAHNAFGLLPIVPYTTRPIREGEIDGQTYHFRTNAQVEELEKEGKIIELRTYQTVAGPWHYFTVDDGQFDLEHHHYCMIGTLESYRKLQDYFGKEALVPVYVDLDDGERLARAVKRERLQKEPNYAEVCRRYLADQEDFSDIHLEEAGIVEHFYNMNIQNALQAISSYLEEKL